MAKLLKGSDLVEYISERQAKQIRSLIQSNGIHPKLAIVNANPDNKVIQTYIDLKIKRADQLGIQVDLIEIDQDKSKDTLIRLSKDESVHGIILQLPLKDPLQTDGLISLIPGEKDVDGMSPNPLVEPATAKAIMWLLAGYNVDLKGKKILIIGKGRLVGAPLSKILIGQDLKPTVLDDSISKEELSLEVKDSDIVITAAGVPSLITEDMLRDSQVIIDCGSAEEQGKVLGDLDPKVYDSKLNLKLTAKVGGVGPLTISCLFENLLQLIDRRV